VSALDDINAGELATAHKTAVAQALPLGVEPPEEWWRELASVVVDYLVLQEYETERPPKHILEAMQSIGELIDPLGEELRALRRLPLSLEWGDASSRLLAALGPVKELAELHVKRYRRMIAAFRGRNNPHRQFLYGVVLDLWYRGLGQELSYSRTKGTPSGPLIRFFAAVVGPILGDKAPSAHGIAKIIDRAQHTLSNSKK
jgi:hypothetical protein